MQYIDKAADRRAAALLRKYDKMRQEFRQLEDELTKAAVDYGKRRGYLTYRVEHMRLALELSDRKDAA